MAVTSGHGGDSDGGGDDGGDAASLQRTSQSRREDRDNELTASGEIEVVYPRWRKTRFPEGYGACSKELMRGRRGTAAVVTTALKSSGWQTTWRPTWERHGSLANSWYVFGVCQDAQ